MQVLCARRAQARATEARFVRPRCSPDLAVWTLVPEPSYCRSLDGAPGMNPSQPRPEHGNRDARERNLTSISPFFIVRDLQASISHYLDRLGFQLDFKGPPGDVYYAHVSRDGIGIMLKAVLPDVLRRPNHTRHEWARWDAYIYTLDPDTLFAEFKQRGASFVKELSFIDDGLWGFEVTDADGYVLAFFRTRNE